MNVGPRPVYHLRLRSRDWTLGQRTLMGIVNVTPDSFSDGGQWATRDAAVAHAMALVEAGADILDIGGESTRPFSDPVSRDEELRRVLPVIEEVRSRTDIPISIDTTKAEVAYRALRAGADILNDVSALRFDPEMGAVAAETRVPVILMHMLGTPKTMQNPPGMRRSFPRSFAFWKSASRRPWRRVSIAVKSLWIPESASAKRLRTTCASSATWTRLLSWNDPLSSALPENALSAPFWTPPCTIASGAPPSPTPLASRQVPTSSGSMTSPCTDRRP